MGSKKVFLKGVFRDRKFILNHFFPAVLFAILVLFFFISFFLFRRVPVIDELSPMELAVGSSLTILGRHFGDEGGNVLINGTPIGRSYINQWSDRLIRMTLPNVQDSGLLSIKVGDRVSDQKLFILSSKIPESYSGFFLADRPILTGINQESIYPGSLVELEGSKLGERQNNGRLLLSKKDSFDIDFLQSPNEEEFFELTPEYIRNWKDEAVSFILPQEARTGGVYIHTPSGYSNPISITVAPTSYLHRGKKRTLFIKQEILLYGLGAFPGNSLTIWPPVPVNREGQTLLTDTPQFLFVEELKNWEQLTQYQNYKVETQSIRYDLEDVTIPRSYGATPNLPYWLEAEEDIPLAPYRARASQVTRRLTLPYAKARALFTYVLENREVNLTAPLRDPENWLEEGGLDAWGFAALYVSLARNSGIPARVVSGVWFPPEEKEGVNHHWVEIYLPNIGWFPVDPGAQKGILGSSGKKAPGGWGYLDNGYVAFSRGREKRPLITHFPWTENPAPYGRQSHYANRQGNLETLSIDWYNLRITDGN